ncbi:MAG: hypothetical protein JOY62_18500 [Acidobacteriaceae bacterium]|nr:hypothetical protein [Acidobacteriaceae bacterium]MBV9781958.1 hypothetical protein [Acidobacteriaceae bacterium]
MRSATKATKTFSLDKAILAEVKRSKGTSSESERVNTLLKFALDLEKRAALYEEAANFFASPAEAREDRRAFESASLRAWRRG